MEFNRPVTSKSKVCYIHSSRGYGNRPYQIVKVEGDEAVLKGEIGNFRMFLVHLYEKVYMPEPPEFAYIPDVSV